MSNKQRFLLVRAIQVYYVLRLLVLIAALGLFFYATSVISGESYIGDVSLGFVKGAGVDDLENYGPEQSGEASASFISATILVVLILFSFRQKTYHVSRLFIGIELIFAALIGGFWLIPGIVLFLTFSDSFKSYFLSKVSIVEEKIESQQEI